jgi:hypothetical protein
LKIQRVFSALNQALLSVRQFICRIYRTRHFLCLAF